MLEPWLRETAGPVIRYRTAVELAPFVSEPGSPGTGLGADIATLHSALLADRTVRRWLGNLRSYEELLDVRRRGAGGTSSFLHGATDLNVEVAMPKLAQLGLRASEPELDARTRSWRALLEAEVGRDYGDFLADDDAFLRKVYSVYDRQLVTASGLARPRAPLAQGCPGPSIRLTTQRGTYLFPKGYPTEAAGRGYWVRGDRMGLGEDRRRPEWREESTFWMLHLLRRAGLQPPDVENPVRRKEGTPWRGPRPMWSSSTGGEAGR